jgi:hypothetical protein
MERLKAMIEAAKPRFVETFWFAIAVLFLVESWLWDNVKEWLRRLEQALGLERFEPWLEGIVTRSSPQATLALFLVPMLAVFPFKLGALALLASGHVVLGIGFIFLVKTLALGVEAFLFDLCRDKLLEMAWFGHLYSLILDARAWASLLVRPYRARLHEFTAQLRQVAATALGENGAFARRLARLRELAKAKRSA